MGFALRQENGQIPPKVFTVLFVLWEPPQKGKIVTAGTLSLLWRWFHHLSNVYTLYGVCNIIYLCVIVEILCLPHSFSIILRTFYVIPPVSKILDVILYNKRFSIHERRSSTQISSSSINQPEYKMTRQMDKGISLSFETNLELVCKLKAVGTLSIRRWRRKAFPSCLLLGIFREKVKEGRIHKQSAHLSDRKTHYHRLHL